MFGRSKQPKRSLPKLTPEMHHSASETIEACLAQVSVFMGQPVRLCPEFSALHDERIGTYAAGFLTGYLQMTGADRRWSNGDPVLMDVGALALCASVLNGILGQVRGVRAFDEVPLVCGPRAAPDLHQLYRAGGTDGIAHAMGSEKQFGGLLLNYLERNVTRPVAFIPRFASAQTVAEQALTNGYTSHLRDSHDHLGTSAPASTDSREAPLVSLADLGSRIDAARARHLKRG